MLYGGTKLKFVKSYIQTGAIIFSIIFQYFSFHNNPFEETLNVVLKLGYDPISNNFTIVLKRLCHENSKVPILSKFSTCFYLCQKIFPAKSFPFAKQNPRKTVARFIRLFT